MNPVTLYGGTWNLDNNRPNGIVVREVETLLRGRGLDFLCVQEAQEYANDLRMIVGYDLHTTRGRTPSQRDAGILVRHGLPTAGYRLVRTRQGWPRTKRPGIHWPRSFPSVKIAGIRVWSVHMPRAIFTLAYAECWTRLVLSLARSRGPQLAPGDYNKRPAAKGMWTPRQMARLTRCWIKGKRIDHIIGRGCYVRGVRTVAHGASNHMPVLFTVTRGGAQ